MSQANADTPAQGEKGSDSSEHLSSIPHSSWRTQPLFIQWLPDPLREKRTQEPRTCLMTLSLHVFSEPVCALGMQDTG